MLAYNNPLSIISAVGIITVLYLVGLSIYRLYLSPLSKFPGPKLAALTKWYEFYYEVYLQGKFIFKIDELHKQYGEQHQAMRINTDHQVQSFESPRLNFMWQIQISILSSLAEQLLK